MLGRASTTVAISVGMLLTACPLALAGDWWGNVDCGQGLNPSCNLGAGKGGAPQQPGSPGDGKKPGGNGKPQTPGSGGASKAPNCTYVRSNYQPVGPGVATVAFQPNRIGSTSVQPIVHLRSAKSFGGAAQPKGAWYVYQCSGAGIRDALYRPPVWIADGDTPGAVPLPSPEELAQQARSQLRLPSPKIVANPAGVQLVNLPTWMWLSGGWEPASATAAVPGVSVTATAKPTLVSWSMGDASSVTCKGPGTPFRAGTDPKSASPDCGHTYRTSSANQVRQEFPVTATVHWTISWSGAGQSGVFPDMTTSASTSFRVAESQALNNTAN